MKKLKLTQKTLIRLTRNEMIKIGGGAQPQQPEQVWFKCYCGQNTSDGHPFITVGGGDHITQEQLNEIQDRCGEVLCYKMT